MHACRRRLVKLGSPNCHGSLVANLSPSGLFEIVATRLTFDLLFYTSGNMKSNAAVRTLGALAQETRLDIFRLLVREGPDGVPAGLIGERRSCRPTM